MISTEYLLNATIARMLVSPPDTTPWWDWSLSNVLSALQLVVTVAGFYLAWMQLRRTATATETSAGLLEKLRIRLVGNDLIVLLPDLHDLEDELDEVVTTGDARAVEKVLVQYSRKAGELLGIMDESDDLRDDPLAKSLRLAARACVKAKAEISEDSSRTLADVIAPARKKVSTVSHDASSLRSRLQRKGD